MSGVVWGYRGSAGVNVQCQKGSTLLCLPFPRRLVKGNRLFLVLWCPPPLGLLAIPCWRFLPGPCLMYMEGNKKSHSHIILQVPRFLDSHLSSSIFQSLPMFAVFYPGCYSFKEDLQVKKLLRVGEVVVPLLYVILILSY